MLKGLKQGFGIFLALVVCSGLFAFVVSGPIKTWTAGETLTAADMNANTQSLKTAVESASQIGSTSVFGNSSTTYSSLMTWSTQASETVVQYPVTRDGTIKNVRVLPYTNTCTVASTVTFRKNATDTGIVISIPAGSTASVTTATTVSFVAGDLLSWKTTCTNGMMGAQAYFDF